jgi:hypothetical protein
MGPAFIDPHAEDATNTFYVSADINIFRWYANHSFSPLLSKSLHFNVQSLGRNYFRELQEIAARIEVVRERQVFASIMFHLVRNTTI